MADGAQDVSHTTHETFRAAQGYTCRQTHIYKKIKINDTRQELTGGRREKLHTTGHGETVSRDKALTDGNGTNTDRNGTSTDGNGTNTDSNAILAQGKKRKGGRGGLRVSTALEL